MADGRREGALLAVLAVLISLTALLFGEGILKDFMHTSRPNDVTATVGPTASPEAPSITTEPTNTETSRPTSAYTAMELFGAAPGNGTCHRGKTISKYDIEAVHCPDGEYDRYFYKYSNTDPDGWLAEVIRCKCFTDVRLERTYSCTNWYSAKYTIDGENYNAALVVYRNAPFVAQVSAKASVADLETVSRTDWYTTNNDVLC